MEQYLKEKGLFMWEEIREEQTHLPKAYKIPRLGTSRVKVTKSTILKTS